MIEEKAIELLRTAYERECSRGPSQHPERTPGCPRTARYETGVRKGWAEYREHVAGCTFCSKVSAMQWNIEPPGVWSVARHLADGTVPDDANLRRFLDEPRYRHFQNLFRSVLVRSLAELMQAGREAVATLRAAGAGAQLSSWVLAPANAADRRVERFQIRCTSEDGSLVTTVRQTAGDELEAVIEGKAEYAGRKVAVELVRQEAESLLAAGIELKPVGKGVQGIGKLGKFRELAATLQGCSIVTTWAAEA